MPKDQDKESQLSQANKWLDSAIDPSEEPDKEVEEQEDQEGEDGCE